MTTQPLAESRCTAMIEAPIEFVDIPAWLFTLPTNEYLRCSPAHIAAGATTSDDGKRMSINVEMVGGTLFVQNYVEDLAEKDHCRVLSTSDIFTPAGRSKIHVTWELSVQATGATTCELTNHVLVNSTPEYDQVLGQTGVPFEQAVAEWTVPGLAHNQGETPLFAKSIEALALQAKANTSAVTLAGVDA